MQTEWTETYIVREIVDPLPKGWAYGHYVIEAHRDNGIEAYCCPVGQAWVNCAGGADGTMPPVLEFIHVLPQFQRQDVATRLALECLRRWPDLLLTEAISLEGEALVRRLERIGVLSPQENTAP